MHKKWVTQLNKLFTLEHCVATNGAPADRRCTSLPCSVTLHRLQLRACWGGSWYSTLFLCLGSCILFAFVFGTSYSFEMFDNDNLLTNYYININITTQSPILYCFFKISIFLINSKNRLMIYCWNKGLIMRSVEPYSLVIIVEVIIDLNYSLD